MRRLLFLLALLLPNANLRAVDTNNVRLPPGFKIELYSDAALANDIQAMTLDRHGRVVVTGPGYVKTLHADPTTGKAIRATTFATPRSGGMGLCFDGDDLLITADHWLSRYRDANADGVADGPPEHILPFVTGEHGGHAIRKGPDGCFYVIAGNDAGIDARHVTARSSPVLVPEAGGIVRLSRDFKSSEVIAHGFRNPYDFDFDASGDMFAYDSDCERDESLPWSTPTRVFRVAIGGHLGWRLKGYLRSFARRPGLFDTITPFADMGRGSPTGVVCYRHESFPEHYRGGLFLLDWTFGRIHFLPIGAGDTAKPEPFLEPIGGDGFAPTDVCVAPDGSLFVSIGGRKTRGAVYRITHDGNPAQKSRTDSDLDRVLTAPQPLDAWSRDTWVPLARKLGREPFERTVIEHQTSDRERMRAVEILVELFDGPSVELAERAWGSAGDSVRARIAWGLSRRAEPLERLARLDDDRGSRAVQAELIGLAALDRLADPAKPIETIGSPRLVPAFERFLRTRSRPERDAIEGRIAQESPQSRLLKALASHRVELTRESGDRAIRVALSVLGEIEQLKNSPYKPFGSAFYFPPGSLQARQRDAVRLLIVALGDWDLNRTNADAFTPYTLAGPLDGRSEQVEKVRTAVRKLIPSSDPLLDEEATRLLAMLRDPAPSTRKVVVGMLTSKSTAPRDLHSLIVYDRLTSPDAAGDAEIVAAALCSLDVKLGGRPGRIKQTWNLRVGELFASLSKTRPGLVDALIARPDFARSATIAWAASVDPKSRENVARAFFDASKSDREGRPVVDETLLELFDALPRHELLATIRARSDWAGTGAGALIRLAENPIEADRSRFLSGLTSRDPAMVAAALKGLESLSPDANPAHTLALFTVLRRLIPVASAGPIRERVAALIARAIGDRRLSKEPTDSLAIARHYAPLFVRFNAIHPETSATNPPPRDEDRATWKGVLMRVDRDHGSVDRGATLFRTYQCASCHVGAVLGPDLAGVGRRLSVENLFTAIIEPAKDVAPAYKVIVVETSDGRTHQGILVFESAEGLIVQTGPAAIERIPSVEIESRRPDDGSLMPVGLLQGADARDYSDIYAYLKSL